MDLLQGIISSANALGLPPEDLATLISYETGGTFNPAQPGPTTQWGQHKGLIQFGEPQAKQYGVDWENPIGSQLGPDGAVVKYMLDNGFEPGMSMLDAYSTINAGAPGRYNASDANNGGAPGTVRDKVETQMAGHREKARKLLGLGSDVQPGLSAPMSSATVPRPEASAPQPGLSSPYVPAAKPDAAPFAMAPQVAESNPVGDYLAQIASEAPQGGYGAESPGMLSGGGTRQGGPSMTDILSAIRKQRYSASPMPFGLFPGA